MKRYMLFGYNNYYPCGGMEDFIDSFDDMQELPTLIASNHRDKYHVYDLQTNIIIWKYGG